MINLKEKQSHHLIFSYKYDSFKDWLAEEHVKLLDTESDAGTLGHVCLAYYEHQQVFIASGREGLSQLLPLFNWPLTEGACGWVNLEPSA